LPEAAAAECMDGTAKVAVYATMDKCTAMSQYELLQCEVLVYLICRHTEVSSTKSE